MPRNQSQCHVQNQLEALTSCCIPRSQWGARTAILLVLLIPERLPGKFSWSKCQGNGTEDDHTRYRQTTTAALMRSQLIPYGLKSRQPRTIAPEPIPNHTERMGKLHHDVPGCSRDKHEGNSLADVVTQLWTLKPHFAPSTKGHNFPKSKTK